VTEIKVDRSFVTDMDTDAGNAVIVRSVIELGHNLGISVVAEGVETRESFDQLVSFGCDVAQGYLLSRPLSAEAFTEWRKGWSGLPEKPNLPAQMQAPRPGPVQPAPVQPGSVHPGH
jgi:EAL domain-containing protein (putative c-di-GMP-specific phosphodiesterase class I)